MWLGCIPQRCLGVALAPLFFLAFAGSSYAQTPAPDASPQERTALAAGFAAEKLGRWQKRLNLEDWKIGVMIVRASDLKPKTLGNIHWDTEKKTATIRVLDPADYQMAWTDMLRDMEFTVVHELIHLELSPVLSTISRNDASRREEEHAVNHMADALLKLDRGQ